MEIRILLTISLIFGEIHSLPAQKKAAGRSFNLLEVDSSKLSDEAELIKHIEKYVASVPMIYFEGDIILLQFPDRVNKKTDYRHVSPELINKIVYERNSLDIDKEVVVLTSNEDHIETMDQKKVFVILRRNNVMGDSRLYYASYLYIKDPVPGQIGIHTFGNRKVSVEWDFWDNREQKEFRNYLESISSCQTTIFVPCRSNETFDFPLPKKPNAPGKNSENLQIKKRSETPSNKTLVLPEGGTETYHDFFVDFDRSAASGRAMKFEFQSMQNYGKNKSPKDSEGQVLNFMESDMKSFHQMIKHVVEAGMGLIKNFNGLYGGLGTPEANLGEVLKSLVDVEHPEVLSEVLTKEEFEELEDESKLPSSGGLGGMINADELREAAEEEGFKPKKKVGTVGRVAQQSTGTENAVDTDDDFCPNSPDVIQESAYVKYGWNTDSDPNSLNDPFVGFGACRYHKVTLQDLKSTPNSNALIKMYQNIFRTQCISKDTKLYQKLLKEGVLKIDEDKISFITIDNSDLMRQEKLPHKERVRLYRGMELFFFSKVYLEELNSLKATVAPDNAPLSRNVYTLGKMILMGLASKKIPIQHSIKIGRNFLKTLRIALSKLIEDNSINSLQEKEVNFNDRVYLVGLVQFIVHCYDAMFITPNFDVQKGFELFYVQNRELLENKINLY